ncbi:MAG: ATP-dependent sacrificial sulfur transferase LarE [Planctomycetota bacterium]
MIELAPDSPGLPPSARRKRAALLADMRARIGAGRLGVAFSGGVDSTLLLALCVEALGAERCLAVTARSASLAQDEWAACQRLAAQLGVELVALETRELERAAYRQNGPDRCYHCKTELFERVDDEVVERYGLSAVAYGATADDLGDHRPGMAAAREHAVLAPLADAGLTKAEIRALSQALGLPTWNKPAQPCLASRVPYGEEVTAAKLGRIDAAEALLHRVGLREARVRHHESAGAPLARLEVPVADLPHALTHRDELVQGLRDLGFHYVVLDLEGFRSGRQNDVLKAQRLLPTVQGERS